jgi:hypothetical protein
MTYIQAGSLADLVAGTLAHLGKLEIENIAQPNQDYFAQGWMKKERITLSSGRAINFNLYNEVSGNAQHVGLYDEDVVNIPDLVKTGTVPWRHVQSQWAVEYRSDVLMNSGDSEIVDLIKLRREDCALSLLKVIEEKAWGDVPGTTDEVLPYGIKYWIVKNNTTGFNGAEPGSHTTVGGITLSTSPNFKNYTAQYTTVNKPDLVKKMRTMKRMVGFKSAVNLNEHTKAKMREKYRIYTVESVVADLEDVGEAQNENLGRDIASINGEDLRFRGHPIMWVPELDSDTDDPLYFINHGTFRVHMLKGNTFRETRNTAPHQHNIEQYFEEASYNYVCHNRRLNGVMALDT